MAEGCGLDRRGAATWPPGGRGGRILVAAHSLVHVDERLAGPPASHVVRWSALPYLLPLVTHFEERPRYVEVVVDKLGADITTYGPDDPHSETVRGRKHPLHKVRGGGTAH